MSSIETKIAKWIRPQIRELSAYHVPNADGMVKLDAMENPYRWPHAMQEKWLAVMRDAQINRYPDPAAEPLKMLLRSSMQIPETMQIMLGNGSDELIQILCMAIASPDRTVLAPEPSFVMYRMIAVMTGMKYVGVPLQEDFSLDENSFIQAIEQHQPAVTFIAYPNNPTGNLFSRDAIKRIINKSSGLVVIDEAYHAFADSSFMQDLPKHNNLLVMRTLSKMGLAGLRLGLLAGADQWLTEFDKIRLPYNINVLTQASVKFALDNDQVLTEQTQKICAHRENLMRALQEFDGLTCFPSQANFILFRTAAGQADKIYQALLDQGVLIKNLSKVGGQLSDCLRVTVGTEQENAAFLTALHQVA